MRAGMLNVRCRVSDFIASAFREVGVGEDGDDLLVVHRRAPVGRDRAGPRS